MTERAPSFTDRAHAQFKRVGAFFRKLSNVNRTLKVVESILDITGIETPFIDLSKTSRGCLAPFRATTKFTQFARGSKSSKGPSVGRLPLIGVESPTVIRGILGGLSILITLRFAAFLHKKGVVDLSSSIDRINQLTLWTGLVTGIPGSCLALYSMAHIGKKLSEEGEQIADANGNEYNRSTWKVAFAIHSLTVFHIGNQAVRGSLDLVGVRLPSSVVRNLGHIGRFASMCKSILRTHKPTTPKEETEPDPTTEVATEALRIVSLNVGKNIRD